MKLRKITSLTAALSFVLMLLTSVILYIVPHGRVAYWADWRLWGMTKTEWGNLHINLGLLFLIALALHVYYNWKPLISYLKDKARRMKVWTPEFNVAVIVTVAVAMGTYFLVPPFGWMMSLNDYFKDRGTAKYGEPPYGHAELSSLKNFAAKMDLDLDRALVLLDQAGYRVKNADVTLAAVGKAYGVPPQTVYEAIRPAAVRKTAAASAGRLPDSPPPGTGNLTLDDLCAQYQLDCRQVESGLKKQGIAAAGSDTLKKLSADNGTNPIELYEKIRAVIVD
jgi:hypothetical protein